ncbi:MAG: diaminopimelate epimerase [Pseudomonadota bacterium]
MHGAGNDFVVIDLRAAPSPVEAADMAALVRGLGDRHRGVGFDQLAVLEAPGPGSDAAVRVVFWNADGSTSAACGNATRCLARLLLDEGAAGPLAIEVAGRGRLEAALGPDGITVDMGTPVLDWAAIPLARAVDPMALPIEGPGRAPIAVGMGNPHCVHVVETLDGLDWQAVGRAGEHHPLYPERTNVQVVEVLAPDRVRARVWERGVGRTLASGSSASAIGVALARAGLTGRAIAVEMEGGTLTVDWGADDHVRLGGPVAHVFDGRLDAAQVAALVAEGER